MKGSALQLAAAAAKIQTAGAAIAALDYAETTLARAREVVFSGVQAHNMSAPVGTFFGLLTGTEQTQRDDLHDHITIIQSLIAGLRARYKGYVGDDLAQEISTLSSMQIANGLQRANGVLNDAIDWMNNPDEFDFVAGITIVIEAAAKAAQKILQTAANLAAGVATAFWVPIVVGAAVVGIVIAWRQGLLTKAGS